LRCRFIIYLVYIILNDQFDNIGNGKPQVSGKKLSQYDMNVYFQLNLLRDMQIDNKSSSKRDIRKMLHPNLDEDNLPSESEPPVGTRLKISNLFSSKNKIKIEPMYYSRYKEFSKMPPTNLDVPVIRNASPYISGEQLYRQEYLKSKLRWTSNKSFKGYFGKASSASAANFIPNYVTITPSEPPLLHKFRDLDKGKWIDDNFKV
jgi:hypothetical protein